MNPHKSQYVSGWVSIPDAVLALSWIALWIVWPSGIDKRIEFRAPTRTAAGYAVITPSSHETAKQAR